MSTAFKQGIDPAIPLADAYLYHNQRIGYFSLNFASPDTIKEAEAVKVILDDIKDYGNGRLRLDSALSMGAASVEERISQLHESVIPPLLAAFRSRVG